MSVPYFYFSTLANQKPEFALNENSSRHIVQSLRMQPGEELRLTDGKGLSALAVIREDNKKRCLIEVRERTMQDPPLRRVRIGLSLLKNAARFEWFLEKATELGVSEIIPLRCTRTEKINFRMDRMQNILESALIQSQQVWMPVIQEPREFAVWVAEAKEGQRFIAHCEPGVKRRLSASLDNALSFRIILIGPEGDFTQEEIRQAMDAGFIAVELGENRLRSETAAVAAAALMTLVDS